MVIFTYHFNLTVDYSLQTLYGIMGLFLLLCLISLIPDGLTLGDGKSISIFNVVKFPNDVCVGTSNKNGTCYTAEECKTIGGVESGSCAKGYGVCCTITLTCETNAMSHTTAQNNSVLMMAATTSPPQRCDYVICPLSSSICRIRLDFDAFTIAGPYVWTSSGAATEGGAMGKCQTDTFSATGSLGGSPVICGGNQNQHMFVDTNGQKCITANFAFGGTSTSRQFNIKVLQYNCADKDMGGPTSCLQYFTSETGLVSSYNYPVGATTVLTNAASPATAYQHLASQSYAICFRRGAGKCALCFSPDVLTPATPSNFGTIGQSFGLSVSSMASSATMTYSETAQGSCTADYLVIPGAMVSSALAIANPKAVVSTSIEKLCGGSFAAVDNTAASATVTVCTGDVPFRIRFETDADEADTGVAATSGTTSDPINRGIVGFSLDYWQASCS